MLNYKNKKTNLLIMLYLKDKKVIFSIEKLNQKLTWLDHLGTVYSISSNIFQSDIGTPYESIHRCYPEM